MTKNPTDISMPQIAAVIFRTCSKCCSATTKMKLNKSFEFQRFKTLLRAYRMGASQKGPNLLVFNKRHSSPASTGGTSYNSFIGHTCF